MAQAPILSIVSRSGTHRSFWAIVPRLLMAAEVRPMLTPMAVTMPGQYAAQLDDRDHRERRVAAALPDRALGRRLALGHGIGDGPLELDLAGEAVPGHLVHAERREELAQRGVRRRVAVFELVDVRFDLRLDEPPHGVLQHQLLVAPSIHAVPPGVVTPVPPASVGSPTLARLGQPTGRHRGRDPRADDGQQAEMAAVAEPAPVAGPTRSRSRFPHFPALDGLKGLAVLAIVVYDLGTHWAKGGHLGADTLFVLMGFLAMASLLTSRADERRRRACRSFWTRRIRRIIGPTLVVLALAVLPSAFAAANALQRDHLAGDGLSTLVSVANWRMIQTHQAFGPATAVRLARPPVLAARRSWDRSCWSCRCCPRCCSTGCTGPANRLGARPAHSCSSSRARCASCCTSPPPGSCTEPTPAPPRSSSGACWPSSSTTRASPSAWPCPGRCATPSTRPGVVAGLFLLLAWVALRPDKLVVMIGLLAVALASAAVVLACIVPEGPVASLLSLPPLRALGRIAIALYLLHWPIYVWIAPQHVHHLHGIKLMGARLVVAFVAAVGAAVRLRTRPGSRAGELRSEPAPAPGGGDWSGSSWSPGRWWR